MRIVSLLPSATEIVCQLGLERELVGVTHECDYPAGVRSLPKVTRTFIPSTATSREIDTLVHERLQAETALYTLDLSMLAELEPDLIVTQALCDVCAVAEEEVRIAACSLPGQPRVINLEPACLEDVFKCLQIVGDATGRGELAAAEITKLRARVDAVAARSAKIVNRPRVIILEWIDPPFSSGHWGPELVRLAGGEEVIGVAGERSRTLDWQQVIAAAPGVMIIACCGFDVERTLDDLPILRRYAGWSDLPCVRSGRVYVVDGSAYFSRPGPRLVDSLEMLAHALDPNMHPLPEYTPAAVRIPR
jgi:iron complex transport system substrate-binding protein